MAKSYYGLHWVSSNDVPLQVRVDIDDLSIWARFAPKNGAWTDWRRLDAEYLSNGVIKGTVENALHAGSADSATTASSADSASSAGAISGGVDSADSASVAGKLRRAMTITYNGDATGTVTFDGSKDVTCKLTVAALTDVLSRLSKLEKTVKTLQNAAYYQQPSYDGGGGEGPGGD